MEIILFLIGAVFAAWAARIVWYVFTMSEDDVRAKIKKDIATRKVGEGLSIDYRIILAIKTGKLG